MVQPSRLLRSVHFELLSVLLFNCTLRYAKMWKKTKAVFSWALTKVLLHVPRGQWIRTRLFRFISLNIFKHSYQTTVLLLEGLMVSPCQRLPQTCLLPKVTGVCRAAFVRYYFDKVSGRCKTFIYGGCQGNQNNFRNLKDCLRKCASKSDVHQVGST